MRGYARDRSERRAAVLLLLLVLGVAACDAWAGRELPLVRRAGLPAEPFSTLYVDTQGSLWLGRPGALRVQEGEGSGRSFPIPGGVAPRIVGEWGNRLVVRSGDALLSIDRATGRVLSERAGAGRGGVLLAPRSGLVLRAGSGGAVQVLDAASLEPLWLWPPLGEPPTATGVSPEEDRVYLAVAEDGGAAALLMRDLQTGRALGRVELEVDPDALAVAPGGDLVLTTGAAAGRASVTALRPRAGEVRLLWRRRLERFEDSAPVELRFAPDARWLAVFRPGSETGLHVLDVETGEVRGALRRAPLDAAFGAGGALYLLYEGEIWIVRAGS